MDLNEYNEERQFIMDNPGLPTIVLMRKFAEYKVKKCNTPAVVWRSESFVCGHPPKQTYLLDGIYHCEKCGGKWESIANK